LARLHLLQISISGGGAMTTDGIDHAVCKNQVFRN